MNPTPQLLHIGWASGDMTPHPGPVDISGQFHARLSEGVKDPLCATALAISTEADHVVFVSCDLVSITDELRDTTRELLKQSGSDLDAHKVVFHATHTHTGPLIRTPRTVNECIATAGTGIDATFDLKTMEGEEILRIISNALASIVLQAWNQRSPGSIAYGLDFCPVGRNRRWWNEDDRATMYLYDSPEEREHFRRIEGFEDHVLQLLATYDPAGNLTGLAVNLACPSQVNESDFFLGADYWKEAREFLRNKFGSDLHILPQCAAAGEQTARHITERAAHQRMLDLRGITERENVAVRITECTERILSAITPTAVSEACLRHQVLPLDLPARKITDEEAATAAGEEKRALELFEEERAKILNNPELRNTPRWYVPITSAFRRANWWGNVVRRKQDQDANRNLTRRVEVHIVRVSDIAFATNPYEFSVDFGLEIRVRSPFLQTFVVQLAGGGTYLPSARAAAAGGYGAIPPSTPVGPEGGRVIVDSSLIALRQLFVEAESSPSTHT